MNRGAGVPAPLPASRETLMQRQQRWLKLAAVAAVAIAASLIVAKNAPTPTAISDTAIEARLR
jgi:hypothetical protein